MKTAFVKTILPVTVLCVLLSAVSGFAAFQDDPADPDGDGFTNGEEQLMGTSPSAYDVNLNDTQLVTLLQKRAFDFFWLESKAPNFFTPDRGIFNEVGKASNAKSIASTGFALTAFVIADSNGWVDHVEAYNKVKAILSRFQQMQRSADPNLQKHGFFYHFTDSNGFRFTQEGFNSEISSIDHALLLAGALFAAQYYKGTEVEALAKELYDNTDWNFMFDGQFFYQGWIPNGGPVEGGTYFQDRWNRYSELMILLLEGIGSTTHPVSAQTWNDFDRGTVTYKSFPPYVHCGALFTHQFSHVWVDFRRMKDKKGINYFDNSVIATLVNRQFCIDLNAEDPSRYETYGLNSWGLSSADSSVGYIVLQPDFFNPATVEWNTDSGTVVPDAAISSIPFTPYESMQAAQNWFTNFRTNTFGRYGFRNAFNFGKPNNSSSFTHFPSSKISLDCGTVATMIENFRTGLVWKFFGRSAAIQDAMNKAGFVKDPLPWQMNFDNQPTPGQDPNSFGGFSGAFGPGGTSSYVEIASIAMEGLPVGGYVWKIGGTGVEGGAFNTLGGHDISRFDTLSFWIRGMAGNEDVRVGLKDTSNVEYTVRISDYIEGGAITTGFKGVRIPLRVFTNQKVRLTTMDNISFRFASSQGGEIQVDEIAFLPDEFKPLAPTGLKGTVAGSDVQLTWNRNTEPDVVGYHIYRSPSTDGPFTKLNTLVVVENSFKDAGVLAAPQNVFHYRVAAIDNALVPNESLLSGEVVLPNVGPKLDPIGNKMVVGGNLLAFSVSAADSNNDTLTFSASNLPPGASFDPSTRLFNWSPTVVQIGLYKGVRFGVTDGQYVSSEEITIAVTDNAIGTVEAVVEDIASGQPSAGGIAFGTVGAKTGFVTATQLVRLTSVSTLNNWKVQVYTDNSLNAPVTIYEEVFERTERRNPNPRKKMVVKDVYAINSAGRGLVGEKDSNYRVPLKWAVFPAKVLQGDLPADSQKWGFVADKMDADFGATRTDRILVDASGALGKYPSTGRATLGPTVFLYFAADFTGVPAQSYRTNQLKVEMFTQ